MTDKEILDEVYSRLTWIDKNWHHMNMDRMFDKVHDMKDAIEREWQKRDEEEYSDQYSTIGLENMADTTYSKHWYNKKEN